MRIIGLSGPAGSGKDTVARALCETQGFVQIAFADPLRLGLKRIFFPILTDEHFTNRKLKEAIIPEIGESPRVLMQTLGTEWGRRLINPDVWVILLRMHAERIRSSSPNLHINGIVISDIRMENEAAYVRSNGQLWHIHRTTRAYTGLASNARLHCSEAGIEWKTGDRCIHNEGSIDDLYEHLGEIFTQEETSCQTTN